MDIQKIKDLKIMLEQHAKLKEELDLSYKQFELTLSDKIEAKKNFETLIEQLKEDIKVEAIAEFEQTQNKKLAGGIGIREMKNIVYDEVEALNWAKKHQLCLALDKKAFETLAKASPIEDMEMKVDVKTTVTFPAVIKLEE